MRTCDIGEVKDGEVFQVDKEIVDQFGGLDYYYNSFVTRDKDFLCLYCNGKGRSVFYFFSHPNYLANDGKFFKKQVLVFDPKELPIEAQFQMCSARVNGMTGCDPEIFVVRGKEKTLLPAFSFLPTQASAEKAHPRAKLEVDTNTYGPSVPAYAYRDGFAAEFFVHPVSCHGYLIDFIRNGLGKVLEAAKGFDRTSTLTLRNSFTIPTTVMKNASDTDIALGCMPSLNAYGDSPTLPVNSREFRLRSAGGHVHLGTGATWTKPQAINIVKACDILAAIPAVGIFASIDTPVRRQFYGRAGEFRQPKHGLEYRVLSNAWLAAPEVAHLVLNLVRGAAKIGFAGLQDKLGIEEEKAQEIINFCDVKAARAFVEKNKALFAQILKLDGVGSTPSISSSFQKIVQEGVEALFSNHEDIEGNWHLRASQEWVNHSNNTTATWATLCSKM